MTVHIVNAAIVPEQQPGGNALTFGYYVYQPTARTLCDKLLTKRDRYQQIIVQRLSCIPIDSATIRQRASKPKVPIDCVTLPQRLVPVGSAIAKPTSRDRTVCSKCLQLARMTPDARTAMIVEAEAQKKESFDKLKAKSVAKKIVERAELVALIEKTRPDALACYDGWLSEPPIVLKRCPGVVDVDLRVDIDAALCRLANGHDGACLSWRHTWGNAQADSRPIEPAPDLDDVLTVALQAFKLEHGATRGDRLWVFREARNGDLTRHERTRRRDVVCRFCNEVLLDAVEMGVDYGIEGPDAPMVQRHTVTCALKYLAQIPNRNDGLPEDSFVLEHDDDQDEVSP